MRERMYRGLGRLRPEVLVRRASFVISLLVAACTPLDPSRSEELGPLTALDGALAFPDGAAIDLTLPVPDSVMAPVDAGKGVDATYDARVVYLGDAQSVLMGAPTPDGPGVVAPASRADAAIPTVDAAVAPDPSCRDDSACPLGSCSPAHLCQAPQAAGASCDSSADCQAGTSCINMQCKAADGASCSNDALCASGSCVSTCRAPARLGARCDSQNDCVTGFQCDNAQCKASVGQTCSADTDCLTGSCYRVCQLPRKATSACDSTPDCSESTCASGVCMKANGVTCLNDAECLSGSCNWESKCMEPTTRLHNCNSPPDCQSPLYCSTCGWCEDGTGGCNN